MKKLLVTIFLIFTGFLLQAQQSDHAVAMKLVVKNSLALGLSGDAIKNTIVSSSYYNSFSGTHMVYLQQSHLGLPVYNQILVLAFKNEKLVSIAGERFMGIDKITRVKSSVATVTPGKAVLTALSEKKLSTKENLYPFITGSNPAKTNFGKLGVALENISAELMWVPVNEGKELKLAWEVYLVPKNSSDYFLIRVDAKDNKIIGESNLTVYCNFEMDQKHTSLCSFQIDKANNFLNTNDKTALVGTANYNVVPWPAESPIHPGGLPALRINPWTMAGGNASSLGWHNDGSMDYAITRGNNVHAQQDRDNNNTTLDSAAVSSTGPDPLNFNFIPNFSITPLQTTPIQNQQFNITNLFYWNNIMHDLSYLYGFDEAAGNFQNDNMGRGGIGGDYVIADAQDNGGTSNANFSTPADGSKPRMQMYLWGGSPQKDGDVDNSIIVHEYTHGISSRLTGGPANSSCLQNGEQMGEGWSDYFALMYTQDWSTSVLTTGFTVPRGLGTYVKNQPYTGAGIRSQKYCTNFAINNKVYAASIPSSPHDRGEIWCATLWDMTWNIINQVGSINSNIFNPAAAGGNTIALKLVIEGMKLQPCSPGFISGRNAILQADQILYGGLYNCAIREAFRRRGMGDQASQGSSGNITDQVTDFSGGVSLFLNQNGMTEVEEAQNIIYTNTVNSSCVAISGFELRDTLPANVTYVSGGTYNAAKNVVSFPVTQSAGEIQNYSFTVNVNNDSYFTPIILLDEQVTASSIPDSWTTSSTPVANTWKVSTLKSQSPPYSFYVENMVIAADQKLEISNPIALAAGTSPKLVFSHIFNTEDGWDGGVVEVSTNGGGSWTDLGLQMVTGGYNGTLGAAPTNAISNRSAFTGTITGFMTTSINLSAYAGQSIKIRFRFGSDDNTSAPSGTPGWFIDNISLKISPVVNMRSGLYNVTNLRVAVADTVTDIIPAIPCINAAIIEQPLNNTACSGNDATFSVNATGASLVFQWQISINGGIDWTDITGATNPVYTVNNVTIGMANYNYRVIVNNSCPSEIISNSVNLSVSNSANINFHPSDISACSGSDAIFHINASGSGLTYQWQVSSDGGLSFTDIQNATDDTITIINVTQSLNGNQYRAIVYSCGPAGIFSEAAILTLKTALTVTSQPTDTSACVGDMVLFTATGSGLMVTYQWQKSSDNGETYINIPGEINSTLTLINVSSLQNGNKYRSVLSGNCVTLYSNAATLTINIPVSFTTQPGNQGACSGSDISFNVIATGIGITYQWEVSINNGPWETLSNATPYSEVNSNILNITGVTTAMNGYRYRVIASGIPCGETISNAGTLLVYNNPDLVLLSAEFSNLAPGMRSMLYTTVSPTGNYTYQWFKDGLLLPNVSTSTYSVDVDRLGDYIVTITDLNGCSINSNGVHIGDSITDAVFIYPNPNTGQFQVRYYNQNNETKARMISLYDAKGIKVYEKRYLIVGMYDRMDVDVKNLSPGIYMLELRDEKGKRLATDKVIVN